MPRIRADPLAYLARTAARYGDLVAFPMPRTPTLLVNSVAGVRRVLVDNQRVWSKQTVQYRALSMVTGVGLLTADGDAWRTRRRLDQPAFHHDGLGVVAAQSVASAERLLASWPDDTVADVDEACLQATLEVVGRTLFGADLAADGERLVAAVLAALRVVVARARTPVPVPSWAPTRGNAALRHANRTLDEACAAVIGRRRHAGVRPGQADLLALLLSAADAGHLSQREVRDELVTMVIAGHETVASSLTWTLHLLAGHPEAQRRLHSELDDVLGPGPLRAPGWADLDRLPYARAAVDESLRLYPPAWVLSRRAVEADVVDGVAVPTGTLVVISPWLLHRRPDTFADPGAFRPERFVGAAARAVPRGAYVPFGAGTRLCIGRDFALVEQVLMLATLLRDHGVEPVPGHRVGVDALVTLRPRGGLPLRLTPRPRPHPRPHPNPR